jgi:bifunctional UDP-N-acetylglucosamine pyrophosphorylase/glucosamine-1-phosphate N-acetyltransferase
VDESVLAKAVLEDGVSCGPRAYLRPGTVMRAGSKAGTHVEIKNSIVGQDSKVPHLSYLGDATLGEGVNIGAGTITCNYDGSTKNSTTIGDRVFVGSDTMFVAPVRIGSDAVTGAGSVITEDVPDGALAIERARQTTIRDWTRKHREQRTRKYTKEKPQ